MKARAAVAWQADKPLSIEEIEVSGPKAGEVMVQMVATGVCHTDAFTLSGADPEGLFPTVLGHEGGEVGAFAISKKAGALEYVGCQKCLFPDQTIPPPAPLAAGRTSATLAR